MKHTNRNSLELNRITFSFVCEKSPSRPSSDHNYIPLRVKNHLKSQNLSAVAERVFRAELFPSPVFGDGFRMCTILKVMHTQLGVQLHSVTLEEKASKAALQFRRCHERLITHRRACFCRNFALSKHCERRGGVGGGGGSPFQTGYYAGAPRRVGKALLAE